jgi:drug/metabolite transporter (DMT)-like permease
MSNDLRPGTGTPRNFDPAAVGCCLGALFFWTVGPLFITYLSDHLDAWTQNALRYSVACLIWLPFLVATQYRGQLKAATWRRALIPWIPNVLMQTTWAMCFYYAGPALIVLLTKTNILWIAGLSTLLFVDERALVKSPRFWLGLVLSMAGVAGVILARSDLASGSTTLGILVALATGLFGGLYTISVRIAFPRTDSRLGFSVVAVYTAPALWISALFLGDLSRILQLGFYPWLSILLSGGMAIAVGHVLFYEAIRRLGATIPALVILAQPFTVLLGSHLLFHENMSLSQVLFGILLLAGAGCAILAQRDLGRRNAL